MDNFIKLMNEIEQNIKDMNEKINHIKHPIYQKNAYVKDLDQKIDQLMEQIETLESKKEILENPWKNFFQANQLWLFAWILFWTLKICLYGCVLIDATIIIFGGLLGTFLEKDSRTWLSILCSEKLDQVKGSLLEKGEELQKTKKERDTVISEVESLQREFFSYTKIQRDLKFMKNNIMSKRNILLTKFANRTAMTNDSSQMEELQENYLNQAYDKQNIEEKFGSKLEMKKQERK